jgi:hypothetical protein
MSTRLNSTISANWNEFPQNWWIFAILPNTGDSKYFPRKYGDFFLEISLTKVLLLAARVICMLTHGSIKGGGWCGIWAIWEGRPDAGGNSKISHQG